MKCLLLFILGLTIWSANAACIDYPVNSDTESCAKYVSYQVSDTLDLPQLVADSVSASYPLPACIYYALAEYQCQKHIPACTDANPTQLLCMAVCERGRTFKYDGRTCSSVFDDADFTNECSSTFFSSDTADCRMIEMDISSGDSADYWKWILVGIAVAIGVVVLCYVVYKYVARKCIAPELEDTDLDRPFEHEVALQKKNETRRRAMEQEQKKEEDVARKKRESHTARNKDEDRLLTATKGRSRPSSAVATNVVVAGTETQSKRDRKKKSKAVNDESAIEIVTVSTAQPDNDHSEHDVAYLQEVHNSRPQSRQGLNSVSSKRGLHSVYDEMKARSPRTQDTHTQEQEPTAGELEEGDTHSHAHTEDMQQVYQHDHNPE